MHVSGDLPRHGRSTGGCDMTDGDMTGRAMRHEKPSRGATRRAPA
jgi:hypothetical protein